MPDPHASPEIESRIRPTSDEFRANEAHHRALEEELRARTADVRAHGSERLVAKHQERGKLLARERIDRLLDEGSPFLELSALAAHEVYEKRAPSAGRRDGASGASRGAR